MRSNKNDRDLLSFADDRYILEAERIADADSLREAEKREKRKTRNIVFKYIATAAACFVVVLGLAFVPRLSFWHNESDVSGETSKEESTSVSRGEIGDMVTPWESGQVSLVSVTFKPSESFASLSLPIEFLANTPYKTKKLNSSNSPFNTKGSPEPDNVKLSIMPNTKISSFIGSDLIKISVEDGEHKDCKGVYYNIREDKTECMSCEILSRIRKSDYYVEAYLRSIIEECLITEEMIYAAVTDGVYEEYYTLLDVPSTREFLKTDETPTVEKLGLTEAQFWRSESETNRELLLHKKPIVKIVEYGYDKSRLTFTLSSSVGSAAWGAFVYDLDSNVLKKLDGETIGLPYCTNGYYTTTPEELITLDLSLATGITVSDDYTKIIATVPYFLNELELDQESGTLKPIYLAENVIVFNVNDGTYNALLGNSSGYNSSVSYPKDVAREINGVYYYPTTNNTWVFHLGNRKYELQGEFLKLERIGGEVYVIMGQDGYKLYRLGENEAVLSELPEDVMLYIVEGNERIDLRTLEKTKLFDGEANAVAKTTDGRFIYLYFEGENEIVCIDAKYNTVGSLPLSEEFVEQSISAGNVTYMLFLNSDEDKLLLAYYKDGALVFDREGYLSDRGAHSIPLDPEGASREYLDENFERNLSAVFDHYCFEGKKITVRQDENLLSLAKLICASRVDDYIKNNGSWAEEEIKALFADLGEMLLPYFEYSGNTASVSASLVKKLSGGQSAGDIAVAFEYYLSRHLPSDMTAEFQTNDPIDEVTTFITNGFLKLIYGYWAEVETADREDEKRLFNRLNMDVDSEWMNARVKIEPIVKKELEELLTKENGYCVRSERLVEAVQKLFPDVIEAATGLSYPEYVRSCAYLDHFISPDFFSLRTAEDGCIPQMSVKHAYDKEKLKAFLSELTFEAGEVTIIQKATLSTEWDLGLVPFSYYKYCGNDIVSVGRDSEGKAYAVISGYYAPLSEEQYEDFVGLINESPLFQREKVYDEILNEVFGRS